jgi:hypothetical protein
MVEIESSLGLSDCIGMLAEAAVQNQSGARAKAKASFAGAGRNSLTNVNGPFRTALAPQSERATTVRAQVESAQDFFTNGGKHLGFLHLLWREFLRAVTSGSGSPFDFNTGVFIYCGILHA